MKDSEWHSERSDKHGSLFTINTGKFPLQHEPDQPLWLVSCLPSSELQLSHHLNSFSESHKSSGKDWNWIKGMENTWADRRAAESQERSKLTAEGTVWVKDVTGWSCARVKLLKTVKIKPNTLHKERVRHSAKPEWSPIHQNHQSATKTETSEPIMSQQSFMTVSVSWRQTEPRFITVNMIILIWNSTLTLQRRVGKLRPCGKLQRKAACWGSLLTHSDLSAQKHCRDFLSATSGS